MAKNKQFTEHQEDNGLIYFIGNAKSGPIKIGFTSKNDPKHRLGQLQTASPETLSLIGSFEGTFAVERKIHDFLRFHLVRGEWFDREPALAILSHLGNQSSTPLLSSHFVAQLENLAFGICGEYDDANDEPLVNVFARRLLLDQASVFRECQLGKPLPLKTWLLSQVERDDAIGDLARDCETDHQFPFVGSLFDYLSYIFDCSLIPAMARVVPDACIDCQQAILSIKY